MVVGLGAGSFVVKDGIERLVVVVVVALLVVVLTDAVVVLLVVLTDDVVAIVGRFVLRTAGVFCLSFSASFPDFVDTKSRV